MEFEIEIYNTRSHKMTHWAVYVIIKRLNAKTFLRSFFTRQRAENFIADVKEQFEKGNYECLSLRN